MINILFLHAEQYKKKNINVKKKIQDVLYEIIKYKFELAKHHSLSLVT